MALINCPECGKEISDRGNACIHCGYILDKKINCPECCKEVSDKVTTCSYCGYPLIKESSPGNKSDLISFVKHNYKKVEWLLIGGGVILAILISIISLIGFGRIYFFKGSYTITKIGWIAVIIALLNGIVLLVLKNDRLLPFLRNKEESFKRIVKIGTSAALSLVVIITASTLIANENSLDKQLADIDREQAYLKNELDKYSYLVDLKVSNITMGSNSVFTTASGTITNNSTINSYRYIKVTGSFKNSSGQTIDTDWTFAIDSAWLKPGESKKFELSVRKDYSIKSCTVEISN